MCGFQALPGMGYGQVYGCILQQYCAVFFTIVCIAQMRYGYGGQTSG